MVQARSPHDDPRIPPRYLVEGYRQAYRRIHDAEPVCRYIGNHWYNVNGETVHRANLMDEIARLRSLVRPAAGPARNGKPVDQSVIQRIIARLRAL